MSAIRIRRTHAKPLAEARQAADRMARRLREDFGLDYEWHGQVLRFERPGLAGELHVTAQEIRLEASLGLLLAFLKPRIETEVEQTLDQLLGAPEKAAPGKPAPGGRRTPPKKGPARG